MEYKYQIGEIVYVAHNPFVVTAHGVYLNGDVPVPNYQLTGVKVEEGTSSLPLTDERIHRDNSMKAWYTEGHLLGVEEYYEDRVKYFEERKQLLKQDIQVVEEKIKRFKGLLNQGKDGHYGYVIRTHSSTVPAVIIGYVARHGRIGCSGRYSERKVYVSELVAIEDAAKYNKSQPGCSAVVIPNGTERECRTAEPVWKEEQ